MTHLKHQYLDAYCQGQLGLSLAEFQTGQKQLPDGTRVPVDSSLMQRYQRILDDADSSVTNFLNNSALVLAYDAGGIRLYHVAMSISKPFHVSSSYRCIGTGSDMADKELSDFLSSISRDAREQLIL